MNRYECEFGELLSERFYKKKMVRKERARNLFNVVGVIHLSKEIRLVGFGTEVKKDGKFLKLIAEVERAVTKAVQKY